MKATVSAMIAAQLPPSNIRRVLYDPEWTIDKKPRHTSIDYAKYKAQDAKMGLPCQYSLYQNDWIPLTMRLQDWLFTVECLASGMSYATAKFDWKQFTSDGRCFTNGAGSDTRADYVNGTNILAGPMEWETLVCGGNTVEIIGAPVYFHVDYLKQGVRSYRHYPIRCLDTRQPLPTPAEFLKDKSVCHIPTTIRGDGATWVFPQFNERAVYPVWSRTGELWIWERWL
jgi:hypothetical protein